MRLRSEIESSTNPTRFKRFHFILDAEALDPLAAELWSLGCSGFEHRDRDDGRLDLYVYVPISSDARLENALQGACVGDLARLAAIDEIVERDWMEAYRRQASPVQLGRRFEVDPREPTEIDPRSDDDRYRLRIPARSAFGTGSHASTRLVVELLETLDLAQCRVLDIGTGTGILSYAARLLGAGSVVALDIDPVAAAAAVENSALNRIRLSVFAGPLAAVRPGTKFDVVLANIVPEKIRSDLEMIAACLDRDGSVIFSGILAASAARYELVLEAKGFDVQSRLVEEDWCAVRAQGADRS